MLINKKFISLFCALALSTSIQAEEVNLEQLLNIAINNNTDIKVGNFTKKIKKQEIKKAKASYLPKLSLNADIGEYDIQSAGQNIKDDANSISINANQLLYDFGKTSSNIEASKYNYEASKSNLSLKISTTVLSVKEAYYDILNKYQQIKVNKEAVKRDELQLEQASEYFKAGVRTKIDVTNAKLKLSNSQLKLLKASYDLKTANTKLISILGKRMDNNLQIKQDEKDITKLAKNIKEIDQPLESTIKEGLNNRKEIDSKKAQINTNKENLKNANSQYYPKLDLNASYADKNSDEISSMDVEQGSVTLNLKWDFFTGFSTDAQKKVALENINSAKEELKQQELEIIQNITINYYNVQQDIDSIKIELLNVQLATENLDLATQRYKAGLNDLIELNDAKLEYTQAKSSLVNSYYAYKKDMANLEYAKGNTYEIN